MFKLTREITMSIDDRQILENFIQLCFDNDLTSEEEITTLIMAIYYRLNGISINDVHYSLRYI